MEKHEQHESPLVCNLGAMNAEERMRYQAVSTQVQRSVQEIVELPNGYALRHTPEASTIALVAEFIALERLCCPFLDFALEVEREGGPVWLRLTGREGVQDFLRAELGFSP